MRSSGTATTDQNSTVLPLPVLERCSFCVSMRRRASLTRRLYLVTSQYWPGIQANGSIRGVSATQKDLCRQHPFHFSISDAGWFSRAYASSMAYWMSS